MTPFGHGSPSADHARDPYTALRALARQQDCHRLTDGRHWLITDPSAVTALLHHDAMSMPLHNGLVDRSLAYQEHVIPWLRRFMATTQVAMLQALTARLMDQCLDTLGLQHAADGLTEFAGRVPVAVMCTLLGFPESQFPIVRRLTTAIQGHYDLPFAPGTTHGQGAELFLRQLVARRLHSPDNGPPAVLLEGLRELWSGHPTLTDHSLLDTCTKLLTAGTSTVTGALGNLLDDLFRGQGSPSPEVLLSALATPLGRMRACEMAVSLHTPVLVLKRDVRQPFDWADHRFDKGQRLLLVTTALTGPRRLLQALTEDAGALSRAPAESSCTRKNIAFGHGDHYCLGAPLARLLIAQTLERAPRLLAQWRRAGETIWRPAWLLHEPLHLPLVSTGDTPCT
jgi:cytochrome P450